MNPVFVIAEVLGALVPVALVASVLRLLGMERQSSGMGSAVLCSLVAMTAGGMSAVEAGCVYGVAGVLVWGFLSRASADAPKRAPEPPAAPPAPMPKPGAFCSSCGASVAGAGVFCAACGHRLP